MIKVFDVVRLPNGAVAVVDEVSTSGGTISASVNHVGDDYKTLKAKAEVDGEQVEADCVKVAWWDESEIDVIGNLMSSPLKSVWGNWSRGNHTSNSKTQQYVEHQNSGLAFWESSTKLANKIFFGIE